MPRVAPIQQNFNGGEWSPLVYGRTDVSTYKNALRKSLNGIPLVQGAWARRPGTMYVAPTVGTDSASRLQSFIFSTVQAYALEFGDEVMRVYKDHAAVLETGVDITDITQANPGVVTAAGHGFADGDEVEISGVAGMVEANVRRYTVANKTTDTFELKDVDTTDFTAYTSGGTVARVFTLTTPYGIDDVFDLKFAQSADVLYVAHPDYAPRKIERTGDTAWTISEIAFGDGPYLIENVGTTTLGLSATSGSVTVTASADLFKSTDVGRLIRWKDSGDAWLWLKITAYTSATSVTADVSGTAAATTATVHWRLGVWSGTTGYPGAVTFHEDRLCWGGPTAFGGRFDTSKSSDYENMSPSDSDGTVADDNALSFTLNSSDVNVIRWMVSDANGLLIGTTSSEWVVRASTTGTALTPTNINAVQSTTHGSANIAARHAGKDTLFIQKSGVKLRALSYDYLSNGYKSPDMSLLAEHVMKPGIIQTAFSEDPQSVLWCARSDGELVGFTFEADEKVLGWHRHTLGGASDASGTAAAVESVCVIPDPTGVRDEVWLIVKRYINGATVRYVEYVTKMWEKDIDKPKDAFFVDAGLTYDSTATKTIAGLWHLVGETVQVCRDGMAHPDVKVSDVGEVTLTLDGSKVSIGYGYNSDGETMSIDAGSANGTSLGKTQRIDRCAFLLLDTLGFKFGRDFDNLDEIFFRTSSDDMGVAVPLFTGVKTMPFNGDNSDDGARVCWRFYQPLPGTLLALMPQLVTNDR